MISQVCLYPWIVAAVCCLVVRQPDGIISIITELEPEKTPVSYLQAVDRSTGRELVESEEPPLTDGTFRVRSAKIRVVDPKSGFKVVHHSLIPESQDGSLKNLDPPKEENDSTIQAEPASDYKVVYPSIHPEGLANRKSLGNFAEDIDRRNTFQREGKIGKYGFQTPRRANTVRTEKTTKVRNDNEPTKVYKQTIVRPVTREDEIREVRKYGKPGKYRKYTYQEPIVVPKPAIGEVVDSYGDGRKLASVSNPDRRRTHKEYSNNYDDLGKLATVSNPDRRRTQKEYSNNYDDLGKLATVSNPDRRRTQKEYSSRTVMKFPDGYSRGNERRVESSSKFKTGSSKKDVYDESSTSTPKNKQVIRKFDGRQIPNSRIANDKIEVDQPVQEASSLLESGIEDGIDGGLVDDTGVIYAGGGYGGVEEGYGAGFDKGKHFEKEKGKEYEAAHNSAHGAKGQKGYNKEEAYAKGENEQHGQDENKGYSVEKEGDKKSHLDKSAQHSSGHQKSEGEKGSDFVKEKGHRKGHKKSGFRTVHHKDEYKKNEEFFDEEHDSGEAKKHGHAAEEHGQQSGGHDKKAYLDSGHHQASRGHEGGHENGHQYNKQKGYNKEKGHSGHYGNEEEYGKKAGHKEGEVHGHSEYGNLGHYR